MTAFTESIVEQAALAWLEGAGWSLCNGTIAGAFRGAQARPLDYDDPDANDSVDNVHEAFRI